MYMLNIFCIRMHGYMNTFRLIFAEKKMDLNVMTSSKIGLRDANPMSKRTNLSKRFASLG